MVTKGKTLSDQIEDLSDEKNSFKLATDKAIQHDHDVKKTISSEFKVLNCLLMRGNAEILLNRCVVLHPPPSQNEFPEL